MPYLFPLSLRGLGTADVEAFGLYLHRLAAEHGISTGKLLERIVAWHTAEHPELQEGLASLRSNVDVCVYVRPNHTTQLLIDMLDHATGEKKLRCGTFLALQGALDRSMEVFSRRTRWCPSCMLEFKAVDDPGYFKLLWQLKAITHCPTHGTALRDTCAVCGSYQGGLRRRHDCRTCVKCGEPLSKGLNSSDHANSWESQGADLIELVELIASNPELTFPANKVRDVVSAIFDKAWAGEQEGQFWKLIPRDECVAIVTGHQPVSLTVARRIAFRLGVCLSDLLAGTVTMTSEVLNPDWTSTLPSEMRPRKRRPVRDKNKILEQLRYALLVKDTLCPPALEEMARVVGVSVGYLHYHFPTMAKMIIERHKAWLEDHKQKMRLQARSVVLSFFTSEKYACERKSHKHALRVLRAETGLPKNLLREEIATVSRLMEPTTHITTGPLDPDAERSLAP